MISEEELRNQAMGLMGQRVKSVDFGSLATSLNTAAQENGVEVTAYGYVMFMLEHYGGMCAYNNVLSSGKGVKDYVDAARKYKEDMPSLLLNAHEYVSKMLTNIPDLDACMKQLEGMTFPYVLYVLFAGGGQSEVVARYRPEMEEQMKRYPSTLDALPESYRKLGKGFDEYADTDEA